MIEKRFEKLLSLVGDANRYQALLILFATVMFVEITFILLGSPFVFMNPSFKCVFTNEIVS